MRLTLRFAIVCASLIALIHMGASSSRAALTWEILDLTNPTTVDPINGVDSYERGAALGGDFITSYYDPTNSAGTGTYQPFLRMQSGGALEQGYNTDLNANFDIKGSFTSPLLWSSLPLTQINGNYYVEFSLDINQSNPEFLSLNQVQLFITAGDVQSFSQTTAPSSGPLASPGVLSSTDAAQAIEIFRMNDANSLGATGVNYEILMDYSLNAGSGTADMLFFVAAETFIKAFETYDPNTYTNVIMYSQFGTPPGSAGANSGFEEWSLRPTSPFLTTLVPEPGSWALMALTGLGAVWQRRRQKLKTAD